MQGLGLNAPSYRRLARKTSTNNIHNHIGIHTIRVQMIIIFYSI